MIRDPDYKVSTHFKFKEVFKSYEAQRLGIDNAPPITEQILDCAAYTAEKILEPVRSWTRRPFSPNSSFRCEELEYVLCAESFFKKLMRKGVEGVDKNTYRKYPTLYILPEIFHEEWREYYERKQHPKGMAVDFELAGLSNQALFDWCRDNLQFDQLILEFYRPERGTNSGWVHGSIKKHGPNRGQLLRY